MTQRYRGKPQAAELIIARDEAEKDYPFTFDSLEMQGNSPAHEKRPLVTPISSREFTARFSSTDYESRCEEGKPEGKASPFIVCAV